MSDFRRHLERSLADEDFRAEWDAQSVEREVTRQIVEARMEEGLTIFVNKKMNKTLRSF